MKRRTGRHRERLEAVSGVVAELLAQGKLGGCIKVAELWVCWKDIVGENVAEHCVPEKVKDGKLYIKADSPVWRQQLDLLKEEVKTKIDQRLQDSGIERIVLR